MSSRFRRSICLLASVAFLAVTGCLHVHVPPTEDPGGDGAETTRQEGTPGGQEGAEDDDPFADWDETLEDTRAIEGFLTLHLKRDNTLYLEVPPERLGSEFGMLTHFSRGLGDLGVQEGLPAFGGTHLMELQRRGDRVFFVRKNPRFVADPGSAMATSLEENVGHSVLAAWDVESRNDSTEHLLVDVTDFFVSDYAATGDALGGVYGGPPLRLDAGRSHVERVHAFPENVEIDAFLTYEASDPPLFGGPGVSDYRSIPIGIRYSLFALPEEPMTPRMADTRVGYFLTARRDFSRDQAPSTYLRYVNRWRLEKQDHSQEVSPPVEPIVYYVDRSVPERYRPYVKEGIEAWNEAFREAGYENAVVARDAPTVEEDSTWSAEDVRYSTIRWTAAQNMGYAIGPSQVDPRTGEILNADILISWSFVRSWLDEYEELTAGVSGSTAALAGDPVAERSGAAGMARRYRQLERAVLESRPGAAARLCAADLYRSHQLGVQHAVLTARGVVPPGEGLPEEYVGGAVKDLVMHEVGHTLGLRHNFRASSEVPHDRLHDESFTGEHGVSLSVMDYVPVNVALDGGAQGHYWNPGVGTYDDWAIRYGYAPVYEQDESGPFPETGTPVSDPEAEKVGLAKIAGESDDPLHAYGTDEDASSGPYGVDPATNRNDLGSDPLRYARDRGQLVASVLPEIEDRLVADGDGWHRLRDGVSALLFEEYVALSHLPKIVGGVHVQRDHRGQTGARPPFVHVPADRQRSAVETLAERAFGPDAFRLSPELLNRMAPDRWNDWRLSFTAMIPTDFPVHRQVLSLQSALLADLLHPERLHRVVDNRVRAPAGVESYSLGELMGTVTGAVWSEVESPSSPREVDSYRRNLQRAHLDEMEGLLLEEEVPGIGGTVSVPEDARSLAWAELSDLSDRIGTALDAGGDLSRETRAHLEASRARIERLLEASLALTRETEG